MARSTATPNEFSEKSGRGLPALQDATAKEMSAGPVERMKPVSECGSPLPLSRTLAGFAHEILLKLSRNYGLRHTSFQHCSGRMQCFLVQAGSTAPSQAAQRLRRRLFVEPDVPAPAAGTL